MTQPPDNQGLGQPRYDDPLSPGTPVPGSVADVGRVEPVDYPVDAGVAAGSSAAGGSGSGSTKDVAKDQAADVKESAKEKGQQVAGVAKEQAAQVTGEAQRQAKDLLHQGRTELKSQTRQQQQRAASGLHTLADELLGMAEGRNEAPGVVADLARDASGRLKSFASQLDNREPAELLDEVRRFARRKPGLFLLGAAAAGVLAGRLTSGVKAAHSDSPSGTSGYRAQSNYVDPTPSYADTTSTYTGTSASYSTAGSAPLPPPPYGTVPPEGSVVPPAAPAGWDDPARRPGGVG
jgi:hypothetical protein